MGKKIDLNSPRTSVSGYNSRRVNHLFSRTQPNINLNNENVNENNNTNNTSKLKQKGMETGLRAAGIPKGIAKGISQSQTTYELANKLTATVKFPIKAKTTILISLIMAPFICLMLFVVLFSNNASAAAIGAMYGKACPTVTVNNTGCNGNGENCSHIYDGEVSFEDYIAGVVAAEVGIADNLEYFKVAAIIARTYFLNTVGNDCTVEGNASYQAYRDIEDSPYKDKIKKAVEETSGLVIVKDDKLITSYYSSACVVNADDEYYYIRYGTVSLGEANFQKVPKSFNSSGTGFDGILSNWYSRVDKNNKDYENRKCPSNHDYGLSQVGALYLIIGENYNYEEVIKYYYGSDIEIKQNKMLLSGAEGFVNPTRYISCSSAFGNRIHPVKGTSNFHTGLDISIAGGEPIYAAKDGVVSVVTKDITAINNCQYGYGNYILIEHDDGMTTLYAHIKYGSIPNSIYTGAEVSQGEQIGEVGSTGCSTGNHLHYEIRQNGTQVDPADYLDLTEATGTCRR